MHKVQKYPEIPRAGFLMANQEPPTSCTKVDRHLSVYMVDKAWKMKLVSPVNAPNRHDF